jgi:hypothetical protein
MAKAGAEVRECLRVLGKTGDNLVGEILRGQGTFYEWNHYPDGDVYDRETHAQYYYHAHPKDDRPSEHGHFHTFLRARGMAPGMRPLQIPGAPMAAGNDVLSHLIAISMDSAGLPIGLFTTNRWVTGETWFAAEDVTLMLDRFAIDHARPSWPVNRWITAMMRLFRPEIAELLRKRDRAVADWAARHPGEDVYEDRRLEVTSQLKISIDDQIRAVEQALAQTD